MAEEKKEDKIMFEREYIVPLREEWLKVPMFRRASKAVKALKQFLVKHMKVYDRDLNKIKVDVYLNNELRFRGMKYPPAKIKVKAIKYESGIVEVKMVNPPKNVEFEIARKARKQAEALKTASEAPKENVEEKKEETKDTKEKEESSKEAMQAEEKMHAKEEKHTSKTSVETPRVQRKVLKR